LGGGKRRVRKQKKKTPLRLPGGRENTESRKKQKGEKEIGVFFSGKKDKKDPGLSNGKKSEIDQGKGNNHATYPTVSARNNIWKKGITIAKKKKGKPIMNMKHEKGQA